MSQLTINYTSKKGDTTPVSVKWADLNLDGKRLDNIIKQCYTKCQTPRKRRGKPGLVRNELSEEYKLAYMDRCIKATVAKARIAETVLGVKQLLKEANGR